MNVLIIGGSNIDYLAYPVNPLKLHDSNPGYVHQSMGGVARNIAENLGRVNLSPKLITLIGKDNLGQNLKKYTENHGVKIYPINHAQQPSYIAILDHHKDMYVAITNTTLFEQLTAEDLLVYRPIIQESECLILDLNMNSELLGWLISEYKKPIYVEATSSQKVLKIKPYLNRINVLKLNQVEAQVLTGISDPHQAVDALIQLGIEEVYLTLGEKGVIYGNHQSIITKNYKAQITGNTTGAGDAFFAGIIYGKIKLINPLITAFGFAHITLSSHQSVAETLNEKTLNKTIKEWITDDTNA